MKRIVALFSIIVLASVTLSAQVAPGMKYMELNMYPSFDFAMTANGTKAVPGMTLALTF